MKAIVSWKGNLKFDGRADSGFVIPLDTGALPDETRQGAGPMELLAIGLAGCTAMDVISILQKKRQNVTSFDVTVNLDRASEHPKVFTHATITYLVYGRDVQEDALLRAMELSAQRYCPAQAMLGQVFPIDLHYEIYDDDGSGGNQLIYKGIMQDLPQE